MAVFGEAKCFYRSLQIFGYYMKTIELSIPDYLDLDNNEAKMLLASKLYEMGRLTIGQAAEFVDLSKATFMELLSYYNVALINYPPEDLEKDISTARKYSN